MTFSAPPETLPLLPGLQVLALVAADADLVTVRANRDGQMLLVTVPRADPPPARALARLLNQLEICRDLVASGVARTLSLAQLGHKPALLLADVPGQALALETARGPMQLPRFLDLAIAMTQAVAELHDRDIVHRNLSPHSLLVDPDGHATLFDLGFGMRLQRRRSAVAAQGRFDGRLLYASPEQTGRMNRGVDHRTDCYALGVSFFEMLTGHTPFAATDPLELVHCHIARVPKAAHEVNEAVPPAISAVVAKLLAKMPEDRYQTARGLLLDLEHARHELHALGWVPSFEPGAREVPIWLRIPGKLYGREPEVAALGQAWQATLAGKPSLVVVRGPAGVGKSQVIGELRGLVAQRRGFFVTGKFDAVRTSGPYASVMDAVRELARQALAESDSQIAAWRAAILAQLGPNARIVVDQVSEVAPIVGELPPLPPVPDSEAQNRFRGAFRDFIRVFATAERPLVLFLDDVQWADPAALELLRECLTDAQPHHLLVVCATRKAEGQGVADAALAAMLAALADAQVAALDLRLEPLGVPAIAQLLGDTMRLPPAATTELAEAVAERTGGNPLLVRVMVETLYDEDLLRLDVDAGRWTWDLPAIRLSAAAHDVVDYIDGVLQRLAPDVAAVVKAAACLGATFSFAELAAATQLPLPLLARHVRAALSAGVLQERDGTAGLDQLAADDAEADQLLAVVPADISLSFGHDRLQQGAYALLGTDAAATVHGRIGAALLATLDAAQLEDRLLEVVDHLNRSAAPDLSDAERLQRIALNLRAGRKARATIAYVTAATSLRHGADLVRDADWHDAYPTVFALHLELALCTALVATLEAAEPLFRLCLNRARTPLDKARVHASRIPLEERYARMDLQIADALAGLRLLGVPLPERPSTARVGVAMLESRWRMRGRKPADLVDLPLVEDERVRLAAEILQSITGMAYSMSANMAGLTYLTLVNLTLRHGLVDSSPYGMAIYGLLLATAFGDYDGGDAFGLASLQVADRLDSRFNRGRCLFLNATLISHWSRDVRHNRELLLEARPMCERNGDIDHVTYVDTQLTLGDIIKGTALAPVLAQADGRGQCARKWRMLTMVPYFQATTQWAKALRGETNRLDSWEDAGFHDAEFERALTQLKYPPAEMFVLVRRLSTLVLGGNWFEALRLAELARANLHGLAGQLLASEFTFFHGLALADGLAVSSGGNVRTMRRALKRHIQQLGKWARRVPINFAARHLILQAELARLDGASERARGLFAAAIAAAGDADEGHTRAMACERAARLHHALGRSAEARELVGRAVVDYARWGATAKVTQLEAAYPQLFSHGGAPALGNDLLSGDDALDLQTVLKAAQAVSSDIRLGSVLGKVMSAAIENAGARTGFLLLDRDGQLKVEAASSTDRAPQTQQGLALADVPEISAHIVHFVARTGETVLLEDARHDPRFAADPHFARATPVSVLCVPLVNQGRTAAIIYLENDLTAGAFTAGRVRVLQLLSAQAAISIENARLYEEVEGMLRSFARFVPTEFLQILRHTRISDIELGESVCKEMSVLFSDIRGFTSLMETMTPDENIGFLNAYLTFMEPCILENGGFVDTYIGDAIMALFAGDADTAVNAAVAMQRALEPFNAGRRAAGKPAIEMGIGINTGELTLGTIGGHDRIKCTVLGDSVNLASRVESLTKKYAAQILLSDATLGRLKDRKLFDVRPVDRVRVVGRVDPVELFEVFSAEAADRREAKRLAAPRWETALGLYYGRHFADAHAHFLGLADVLPDDVPCRLFLQRSAHHAQNPPPASWDGVEVLDHK